MKQKFTLSIADLQVSVITDGSPEEVERISGILDRKMREVYLKSRCPKTEAALLCALEAVADRLSLQAHTTELEERCEKYALVLENLKERTEDLSEELERLRSENAVLRTLLTRTDVSEEEPEAEHLALDPISPTAFLASVAEAQSAPPAAEDEKAAEDELPPPRPEPNAEPVVPAAAPAAEEAPRRRSRVGSMFDLLSFSETD